MKKNASRVHDTVRLEKYVDKLNAEYKQALAHLEQIMNDKFEAQERIRKTSDQVMNERLARMNEFREQINKERGDYVMRETLEMRLKPLEARQQFINGRDAAIVAAIALLLAVAGIILGFFGR